MDYDYAASRVYYDESSPTCLRWTSGKLKNKIAGSISFSKSGEKKSAYIRVSNYSYVVSRLIWYIHNKYICSNKFILFNDDNIHNLKIENLAISNTRYSYHRKTCLATRLEEINSNNTSLSPDRFYVYLHIDSKGIVRYVGKGTGNRAYSKCDRNKEWKRYFPNILKENVIIYKDNLTNEESFKLEEELILLHRNTIVNSLGKRSSSPKEIPNNISSYVYYDDTSPTFLRWKMDNGWTGNHFKSLAGGVAGSINKKSGYTQVVLNKTSYKSHRVIWYLFNGEFDKNMVIDHIDRNPANNSISNLRCVSNSVNNKNRKINNSPYKCLVERKNTYVVTGIVAGKRVSTYFPFSKYGSKEDCFIDALNFRNRLVDNGIIILTKGDK